MPGSMFNCTSSSPHCLAGIPQVTILTISMSAANQHLGLGEEGGPQTQFLKSQFRSPTGAVGTVAITCHRALEARIRKLSEELNAGVWLRDAGISTHIPPPG